MITQARLATGQYFGVIFSLLGWYFGGIWGKFPPFFPQFPTLGKYPATERDKEFLPEYPPIEAALVLLECLAQPPSFFLPSSTLRLLALYIVVTFTL